MIVGEALFKLLSTDTDIVAMVGQRIYPGKFPQDVGGSYHYPAIIFRKTSEQHPATLNPANPSGDDDLMQNQWLVFCVGLEPTYSVQARLAELVRRRLHKFQGTVLNLVPSPIEQIEVQGIFAGTARDFYDDKTQTFQVICDYDVWAGEQQPLGG